LLHLSSAWQKMMLLRLGDTARSQDENTKQKACCRTRLERREREDSIAQEELSELSA
jgi:hypothetical protein